MTRAELEKLAAKRYSAVVVPGEPVGWTYDIASGLSTWTPGIYLMLGMPVGDGHPPANFGLSRYSPESRAVMEAVSAAAEAQDGGSYDVPVYMRHELGHYVLVRVTGRVTSIGGVPAVVNGTVQQIEARMAVNAPFPG